MLNIKAHLVRATVLAFTLLIPAFTYAAENSPQAFSIGPQPLSTALSEFAKQSQQELLFSPDIVAKKTSNGVQGTLQPLEALGTLLRNTGISFSTTPSGAILLRNEDSIAAAGMLHLARSENPDSKSSPTSEASSPASEDTSGKLEEIVVTAQKRTERLIDVPISLTVVGGRELDRSTDRSIAEVLNRVPGVVTAVSSTNARVGNNGGQVVIRGVAPQQGNNTGASPTAYYLDSIPFGFVRSSFAPDASAYDMERVEVLRGPQGTLYGSSALNGVVRVLTKDADLQRFAFKARASTSSTQAGSENYRGDMAINVPIIEGKLAARAVVGYQDWGGWIDKPLLNRKDANDSQMGNYRLKINAQPTEQLSVGLSAWLSRSDMSQPPTSPNNRVSLSAFEEPSFLDYDAYGLKVGYDFSSFTVNSMTSYIDYSNHGGFDYTPFAPAEKSILELDFDNTVFSQEVLVNSNREGAWRWSFGAMYRDAEDKTWGFRSLYTAPNDFGSRSKSMTVFGETTRAFLDGRLELTGGARYFEDRIRDTERSRNGLIGGTINPNPALPGLSRGQLSRFEKVSPRLVLTWHPADQATLYASYGEGFRSGMNQNAFTQSVAPQFPAAEPDTVKNYEIGAKWSLWGGRINFDTAAFFTDWKGVQQLIAVVLPPGSFQPLGAAYINAGSVSGGGFEFGVSAEPVDGLTLTGTFSWNNLRVDDNVFDANNVLQFVKGVRLFLSPEFAAGTSADYKFPLGGSGLSGRVSASANYMSEMLSGAPFLASIPRPAAEATLMTRASVGIESADHWAGTLYVDNLMNESGVTLDPFSTAWHTWARPRTVGLQFEYRY